MAESAAKMPDKDTLRIPHRYNDDGGVAVGVSTLRGRTGETDRQTDRDKDRERKQAREKRRREREEG